MVSAGKTRGRARWLAAWNTRARAGVPQTLRFSGNRFRRLDDERLAALVARGDATAFEALYDRHHAALLAFSRHMVGNREDGEDALQQTFVRAHRALQAGRVPDAVRPWLFAIARNRCRTLLAARRDAAVPVDEIEPSFDGLSDDVQRRADLRGLVADLGRLPEDQRGALVLFELGDLSHREISTVIGCEPEKVKALVFQARTALIAEREARELPCDEIRGQLEVARAGALRRSALRRHLRNCEPCTAYRLTVARQRAGLALILPVAPSVGLKAAVLGGTGGGAVAAAGGGAAAVGSGGAAASGSAGAAGSGGAVASGGASAAGGGGAAVAAGATASGGGVAGLAAKAAVVAAVAGTGVTGGVATVDAVKQREPARTAPARPLVQRAGADRAVRDDPPRRRPQAQARTPPRDPATRATRRRSRPARFRAADDDERHRRAGGRAAARRPAGCACAGSPRSGAPRRGASAVRSCAGARRRLPAPAGGRPPSPRRPMPRRPRRSRPTTCACAAAAGRRCRHPSPRPSRRRPRSRPPRRRNRRRNQPPSRRPSRRRPRNPRPYPHRLPRTGGSVARNRALRRPSAHSGEL